MSYVDYSANFTLDQFFTWLHANQLGSNDEHLYDTIAIAHNINTSTIDGTHKTNPSTSGLWTILASATYTPTVAGIYQIICQDVGGANLEIFASGAWRVPTYDSGLSAGIVFFDGANMRLKNPSVTTTLNIYYQKFY